MVWRDIDPSVSSPGLRIECAFELLYPLLTYTHVKHVRYFHQSGQFKLNGLDERYYFMVSMSQKTRQNGSWISPSGLEKVFIQSRFMRRLSDN